MTRNTMVVVFNIAIMKEGNVYVAKCIDNTIASQGKTIEEAMANLKEALELYYEDTPEYASSEVSNIFLSTLQITFQWQKNIPSYQENKLWIAC